MIINIKQYKLLKVITITLSVLLFWQGVSWANPDIFRKSTLQPQLMMERGVLDENSVRILSAYLSRKFSKYESVLENRNVANIKTCVEEVLDEIRSSGDIPEEVLEKVPGVIVKDEYKEVFLDLGGLLIRYYSPRIKGLENPGEEYLVREGSTRRIGGYLARQIVIPREVAPQEAQEFSEKKEEDTPHGNIAYVKDTTEGGVAKFLEHVLSELKKKKPRPLRKSIKRRFAAAEEDIIRRIESTPLKPRDRAVLVYTVRKGFKQKMIEFNSIVMTSEEDSEEEAGWLLGFNTEAFAENRVGNFSNDVSLLLAGKFPKTIGLCREVMDLVKNDVPVLGEYLFHEMVCLHLGHKKARDLQVKLFPENYESILGDARRGHRDGELSLILKKVIWGKGKEEEEERSDFLKSRGEFKEFEKQDFTMPRGPQKASEYYGKLKKDFKRLSRYATLLQSRILQRSDATSSFLLSLENQLERVRAKVKWLWQMQVIWQKSEKIIGRKPLNRLTRGERSAIRPIVWEVLEEHEKFVKTEPWGKSINEDPAVREKLMEISKTVGIEPKLSTEPNEAILKLRRKKEKQEEESLKRIQKKEKKKKRTIKKGDVVETLRNKIRSIHWLAIMTLFGMAMVLSGVLYLILPVNRVTLLIATVLPLTLFILIVATNWSWARLFTFAALSVLLSIFLPIQWFGLSLAIIIIAHRVRSGSFASWIYKKKKEPSPQRKATVSEAREVSSGGVEISRDVMEYISKIILAEYGEDVKGNSSSKPGTKMVLRMVFNMQLPLDLHGDQETDQGLKQEITPFVVGSLREIERGYDYELNKKIEKIKNHEEEKDSDLASAVDEVSQEISTTMMMTSGHVDMTGEMPVIQEIVCEYYGIDKKRIKEIQDCILLNRTREDVLSVERLRGTVEAEKYYFLGCLEFDHGQISQAEAAFERAAQVDRLNSDYLLTAGLIKHHLKKWKEARRYYEYSLGMRKAQGTSEVNSLKLSFTKLLIDKVSRKIALNGSKEGTDGSMSMDPVSQIGKLARVMGIKISSEDHSASMEVLDSENKSHNIALTPQPEFEIAHLINVIKQVPIVSENHREMLSSILSLFEKSPPALYTYNTLIEDLFGFARPENNMFALYESLATDNISALALTHELLEYLVKSERVKIDFKNGSIFIVDDDSLFYEVPLTKEEALKEVEKGPNNPHYLLRALQLEVFSELDKLLTATIRGVRQIAEKNKETEKELALLKRQKRKSRRIEKIENFIFFAHSSFLQNEFVALVSWLKVLEIALSRGSIYNAFIFLAVALGATVYSFYWKEHIRKLSSSLKRVVPPKPGEVFRKVELPTIFISLFLTGIGFMLTKFFLAVPILKITAWIGLVLILTYGLKEFIMYPKKSGKDESDASEIRRKLRIYKSARLLIGLTSVAFLGMLAAYANGWHFFKFRYIFLALYITLEYINNFVFVLSSPFYGLFHIGYPIVAPSDWLYRKIKMEGYKSLYSKYGHPNFKYGYIGQEIRRLEKQLASLEKKVERAPQDAKRNAMDVSEEELLDLLERNTTFLNRRHVERILEVFSILWREGREKTEENAYYERVARRLAIIQATDGSYGTPEMLQRPQEFPLRVLEENSIVVERESELGFLLYDDVFRKKDMTLKTIEESTLSDERKQRLKEMYVYFCVSDSIDIGSDYLKKVEVRVVKGDNPRDYEYPKESYEFQKGDFRKSWGVEIESGFIAPEAKKVLEIADKEEKPDGVEEDVLAKAERLIEITDEAWKPTHLFDSEEEEHLPQMGKKAKVVGFTGPEDEKLSDEEILRKYIAGTDAVVTEFTAFCNEVLQKAEKGEPVEAMEVEATIRQYVSEIIELSEQEIREKVSEDKKFQYWTRHIVLNIMGTINFAAGWIGRPGRDIKKVVPEIRKIIKELETLSRECNAFLIIAERGELEDIEKYGKVNINSIADGVEDAGIKISEAKGNKKAGISGETSEADKRTKGMDQHQAEGNATNVTPERLAGDPLNIKQNDIIDRLRENSSKSDHFMHLEAILTGISLSESCREAGITVERIMNTGRILNIARESNGSVQDTPIEYNIVAALGEMGYDVVGLDPITKPGDGYKQGIVQDMPFDDGEFSTIISVGLFDHYYVTARQMFVSGKMEIDEREENFYRKAAKEVWRTLEPGGIFLADTFGDNEKFLRAFQEQGFQHVRIYDSEDPYLFVKPEKVASFYRDPYNSTRNELTDETKEKALKEIRKRILDDDTIDRLVQDLITLCASGRGKAVKSNEEKMLLALDLDLGSLDVERLFEKLSEVLPHNNKELEVFLDNLRIIGGRGEGLAQRVKALSTLSSSGRGKIKPDNIIVLTTASGTQNYSEFDGVSTIAGIDNSSFSQEAYFPLIEIMFFTIGKHLGWSSEVLRERYSLIPNVFALSDLNEDEIKAAFSKDIRTFIIRLIPDAVPFDEFERQELMETINTVLAQA